MLYHLYLKIYIYKRESIVRLIVFIYVINFNIHGHASVTLWN